MHVAFFRNLNLGQLRSPTREQLLAAFAAEGARDVLSHQSNGTVAFSTTGDPQRLADAVVARLGPVCGYDDVVPVRSLAWLAGLGLDELPDGCELTVVDGPSRFPEPLPWRPDGQEVTVLRADRRHAIVAVAARRSSRHGSASARRRAEWGRSFD